MTTSQPAPAPAPAAPTGRSGLLALILGIVAVVAAVIPFLSYIAWAIGIAAIIVGIVALRRAVTRRGMAVTGLVLGIVAVLLSIILSVVYTAVFFLAAATQSLATLSPSDLGTPSTAASASSAPSSSSDDQDATSSGGRTVTYSAKGAGKATSISYLTVDSSGGGQDQVQNVKLPWSKKVSIKDPSLFSTTVFSLVVQAGSGGGKVTCSIKADGKVISKHSSTGAYAVATCSGTAD